MKQSETRKLIERLLDIFVGRLFSIDNDAGWHGESMLGRLIEFHGELPPPSGYDSADSKMLFEIQFVREEHYLLGAARSMMRQLPKKTQIVLVVDRRYRGTVDPRTGKVLTDDNCAAMLGLSVAAYRKTKTRAFGKLEAFISAENEFCERSQSPL